jgi:hypothetical protein
MAIQGFEQHGEGAGELAGLREILAPRLSMLLGNHGTPLTFHYRVVSSHQLCSHHAFEFVLWPDAAQSVEGGPDLRLAHPHRRAGTIAIGDVPAAPKYQPLDRFRDLRECVPGLESGNSSARVLVNQSCASYSIGAHPTKRARTVCTRGGHAPPLRRPRSKPAASVGSTEIWFRLQRIHCWASQAPG